MVMEEIVKESFGTVLEIAGELGLMMLLKSGKLAGTGRRASDSLKHARGLSTMHTPKLASNKGMSSAHGSWAILYTWLG